MVGSHDLTTFRDRRSPQPKPLIPELETFGRARERVRDPLTTRKNTVTLPRQLTEETGLTATELIPATQAELARIVRENADGRQRPLIPVGGHTGLGPAWSAPDEAIFVSTSRLTEVIDYPARDMTITVEAGLQMDTLADILSGEGQQLPIDVPQSGRATVGELVATNPSGPRRYGYGTVRDYLIGVSAVDAQGRAFRAGGRVVKNVAGYDLCKLLIGSLGTLAIVTQATFKLKPKPQTQAIIRFTFPDVSRIDQALVRLTTSESRPMAIDVLNPAGAKQIESQLRRGSAVDQPVLLVGVDGTQREVDWQLATLREELRVFDPTNLDVEIGSDAEETLAALTGFPVYSDSPLVFQASLLSSRTPAFIDQASTCPAAVLAHAGNGVVIGHLPDDVNSPKRAQELLAPLRAQVRAGGGNLVILSCDSGWTSRLPLFGDPEPSRRLAQQLKRSLDPNGLLNPGRFGEAVAV